MAKILKLPQVVERTGLGRSMIYEMVKRGEFPAPVKLSVRSVGWLESAVDAWIESRPEAREAV